MENNYNILINKLDEFIRKFYKNRLLKGLIYSSALIAVFFIVIVLIEYFGHFNSKIRIILFFTFIISTISIFIKFVLLSFLSLYKIGKIITYEQAADIIGNHFIEIQDKLLNILQLKNLSTNSNDNRDLIEASINQKITRLKPIPFLTVIDFRSNLKYLKFTIIPFFIIILIFLLQPDAITETTNRIINYNTYFEKKSPFNIIIENKILKVFEQEDFTLNVKITGEEIPDEIFLITDGVKYKLQKENTIKFNYLFKNVRKDINFQLSTSDFVSKPYKLKLIPKPSILNFNIKLCYPSYIGKDDEIIVNNGDLIIPEGTKLKWKFVTRETNILTFLLGDKSIKLHGNSENNFEFESVLRKTIQYGLIPENVNIKIPDSLIYLINVIPDAYPTISVDELKDSSNLNRIFFRNLIKDDYGFNKLVFKYQYYNLEDTIKKNKKDIEIPINKSLNQQEVFYYFDIANIIENPGDQVEYYFEIYDNDGINGSKMSRSQKMLFKAPTSSEVEKQTENNNKEIKDNIEKTIFDAKKLEKQIKDLNKKLIDKKSLTWDDKKQIKDLLEKQKDIQESVEKIALKNKENLIKDQQYKKVNEEIAFKQKELEKIFQELMTDEMKKMMEDLQKLLENVDKEKVGEMLDKMKLNAEEISKQLDRNLEIFKQLEFEKKLQENIDRLNQLSKDQKKLSDETIENKLQNDFLKKEQEILNQKFDDFKKNLDDIDKKNNELETPNNFKRDENKEKSISEEQKNSLDAINNKKNNKASKMQKNAAQQMQELAEKMQNMLDEMQLEQIEEDIESIRRVLKNLIIVSFNQEKVINKTYQISVKDPKYQEIINEQGKIKDDLKIIEDSLFALSKRQIKIQPVINKEISTINDNVEKSLNDLLAMNTIGYFGSIQNQSALSRQQYVMTSVNNLALLLNESMENMKQESSSKKKNGKNNSSCSKPGSGKSSSKSIKNMRQLQEELNKQIEQLKSGKKPDGKSQGQSMSEQLARMAAQQEAIRRQIQEYMEELKKQGEKPGSGFNELINQMEKTETDLVNKLISQETLNRQKQILTRLLEHEKAEQKREQEEKRESNEAKELKYSNPNLVLQYKRLKLNEQEILKLIPPVMNKFYKNKVNEYFYNF